MFSYRQAHLEETEYPSHRKLDSIQKRLSCGISTAFNTCPCVCRRVLHEEKNCRQMSRFDGADFAIVEFHKEDRFKVCVQYMYRMDRATAECAASAGRGGQQRSRLRT